MNLFWKSTAFVLEATIAKLTLDKGEKDIALLLSVFACAAVAGSAFLLLEPVMEFLLSLGDLGQIPEQFIGVLMKILGIGILSELSQSICADSGNASLGKALQLAATAVTMYISLPLFRWFLELIQEIMGQL